MAQRLLFLLSLLPFFTGCYSFTTTFRSNAAIFTLQNRCKETIWPGTQSGAGHPLLANGGLQLEPNAQIKIAAPTGWSGRFWARTGCSFDKSGMGNCITGDCGGRLQCSGAGGAPPATLAEFTLNSPQDFYDVSLVDGFNVPISIVPAGGSGNCKAVDCSTNVNLQCPRDLRVRSQHSRETVACKSTCIAFGDPQYCCSGAYNSPQICKPTRYSRVFKKACPTSYSYPYDDATSTFTCAGANYSIIFC